MNPKANGDRGAVGRVLWICALWAAVHSLLATNKVKDLVRRTAGPRYRDGLYRLVYNAQAVATLALAARSFLRLPDRDIYRLSPPLSWLLRAGQVISLGVLLSGVRVVGFLDFAGIARLRNLLAELDSGPEPEAQGPPIGPEGEMVKAGAFRFTRHPGQPGGAGVLCVPPPDDGEPRCSHGDGRPLRGPRLDA